MRVSKSDCDTSNDSRMNQVLMTNEHGDVFKRQINLDECDMDPYSDTENLPSSPTESEYFYEQYIDYPVNETTYEQAVGAVGDKRPSNLNQSPFSRNTSIIRNDTLLNYNQYKLQQLHNSNHAGSSAFTFFGMPLPSLSSLWGAGNNARKSNSRADVDANGKSRLRNFRPRPGEIVDSYQYSNNVHQPAPPQLLPFPVRDNAQPTNIQPPPPPLPPQIPNNDNDKPSFDNRPAPPFISYHHPPISDPKVEKGGFVPMLPGRKGFTPIRNPYLNDTDDDDIQETVSTELKPNVDLEFDNESSRDYEPDNKYSVLVPTVSAESTTQPTNFNVSSLRKGEITAPTKSSSGISLIRTSTIQPPVDTRPTQIASNIFSPINRKDTKITTKNVHKSIDGTTERFQTTQSPVQKPTPSILNTPPNFLPNSSDVINLSKNKLPPNGTSNGNPMTSRNALSALVAPGASGYSVRTPPGRSVITKVFNNITTANGITTSSMETATNAAPNTSIELHTSTLKTTKQSSSAPKLPAAEEYLRTTLHDTRESTTPIIPNFDSKQQMNTDLNDISDQNAQAARKSDMDWYYSNYNKSTWKEQQTDPGLSRFSNAGNASHHLVNKSHITIVIFTSILATCNLFLV